MATPKKEMIVGELTTALSEANLTIITDYRGLSVGDLQQLRANLRPHNAEFRVSKNTLTRIAARANDFEGMDELLVGPTALMFAYDDVAEPAKVIRDFVRSSRILQIRSAVLDGVIVDAGRVSDIADLPSRDELLAKIVGSIAAPISGLVNVLSGPQRSLLYTLQARA